MKLHTRISSNCSIWESSQIQFRIGCLLFISLVLLRNMASAQSHPTFSSEIPVTITGLTFDAMEPFISPDGNTLFFNSLNSGGNTNLHYASRVNDSTFTYDGMVGGCYDPSPNHLDAVFSMDSLENCYWVSLRNFPNLHRGVISAGNVTGISRVFGNFNIFSPGWIIMDAGISPAGNELYYCNAFFDSACAVGIPCISTLGVADKVNDSTFNKKINSNALFAAINDTNYLVYAPAISTNGLEFYFTRLLKGSFDTEICVSVRNTTSDPFSLPGVIYSSLGYFPEGPSLSADQQRLYYHRKDSTFTYRIYMRYRTVSTGLDYTVNETLFTLCPNPTEGLFRIQGQQPHSIAGAEIYNSEGQSILKTETCGEVDMRGFPQGIYWVKITQDDKPAFLKLNILR